MNEFNAVDISVRAAITVFPGDSYQVPRSWAERREKKLIYFQHIGQGRPLRGVGRAGTLPAPHAATSIAYHGRGTNG